MESNWRWNVWNLGMSGSDWFMAARCTTLAPNWIVERRLATGHRFASLYIVVPGLVPFFNSPWLITQASRFPYGLATDPD